MSTVRATGRHIAAIAYGAVDAALVVAPAVVLVLDGRGGGAEWRRGLDLVAGSAAVGVLHGTVAARRLWREAAAAARPLDVWIAAGDALVVLGLASTGLLIAVLGGFAGLHTRLAAEGWPVLALWIGVQVVAVAAAEVVGRGVYRWLEAEPPVPD